MFYFNIVANTLFEYFLKSSNRLIQTIKLYWGPKCHGGKHNDGSYITVSTSYEISNITTHSMTGDASGLDYIFYHDTWRGRANSWKYHHWKCGWCDYRWSTKSWWWWILNLSLSELWQGWNCTFAILIGALLVISEFVVLSLSRTNKYLVETLL